MKKSTFVLSVFGFLVPHIAMGQVDPLGGYVSAIEDRRAHALSRVFDADQRQAVRHKASQEISVSGRYLERRISQETMRETDGIGGRIEGSLGLVSAVIGLAFDYEDLETEYVIRQQARDSGIVQTTSQSGSVFGQFFLGNYTFLVQGGYGRSEYDTERTTVIGTKTAEFKGEDYFGFARLDRTMKTARGTTVRPFVAASGSRVELDTFSERPEGLGADARRVSGDTYREAVGIGGVTFAREIGGASPALTVAWSRRLTSSRISLDRTDLQGQSAVGGEQETIDAPYTFLFVADLNVPVQLGDGWTFIPGVRYIEGNDERRWNAGAYLNYRF